MSLLRRRQPGPNSLLREKDGAAWLLRHSHSFFLQLAGAAFPHFPRMTFPLSMKSGIRLSAMALDLLPKLPGIHNAPGSSESFPLATSASPHSERYFRLATFTLQPFFEICPPAREVSPELQGSYENFPPGHEQRHMASPASSQNISIKNPRPGYPDRGGVHGACPISVYIAFRSSINSVNLRSSSAATSGWLSITLFSWKGSVLRSYSSSPSCSSALEPGVHVH